MRDRGHANYLGEEGQSGESIGCFYVYRAAGAVVSRRSRWLRRDLTAVGE
ncbi:hypothetical protein FRUB_10424 [Fimbriiglobus ruber]|uniref:Uncharacterized protein n=1 Tax=Fimbriiglobus ruber TaxID=1908690 RepID=A0A225D0J2_9BACT|nr:hypothetical protein FRUB_10424 [Fimbriiglobus ruber]